MEDYINDLIEVVGLQPEGMPVLIINPLLVRLDKGWVFYSYIVDGRPDESLRLFFYVGKPPSTAAGLGCRNAGSLTI